MKRMLPCPRSELSAIRTHGNRCARCPSPWAQLARRHGLNAMPHRRERSARPHCRDTPPQHADPYQSRPAQMLLI